MNEIRAETQPSSTTVSERLKSLDAYRGLIMISIAFWLICYWLYRRKIFVRV